MIFFQSSQLFAIDIGTSTSYTKARSALMLTTNGENYVTQLEGIIPQLSTTKLDDIQGRIMDIRIKGGFSQYSELLDFIIVLIAQELESRVMEDTISPEAKAQAAGEILAMQSMMGDSMKQMMNDLMLSWEQASNYKEEGTLSMNMDLNIEDVDIEGGIDFKNYEAVSHMFDQSFSGEIDAFIKGMADGESVDIQIGTLLDFISTEGNMYLLMEKLEFTDNSVNKEFETFTKPFIEKLQELGTSKTYLSFSDIDSQAALELLGGISQDNINTQIDAMMAQPLLEAYASEGNNYMLRPSMYFCNIGKSLTRVFDPFYDNDTCSESQYRDMLQEMQQAGVSISLNLEDENTLGVAVSDDTIQGDISIKWENETLNSVEAYFYDPSNKEQNNFSLLYIPNASLTFDFMAEEFVVVGGDIGFGNNGSISTMNMDILVRDFWAPEGEPAFDMNAQYANNTLDLTATGGGFECNAGGQLKSNYIDIDGECLIEDESIGYMFPGETTISMDSTLLIDTRSGKNNLDMTFSMSAGTTPVVSVDVKNTGTRRSIPAASIPAPSKTTTAEEAFAQVYENLYGSFDGGAVNYDPYITTDPETGESLICEEYEYNEETNYESCVKYVPDTYDYDDYYKVDEDGNNLYCAEYEYNAEENFDACINYLPVE